jgi:ribosomal protein L3 glutamine methyltransferase
MLNDNALGDSPEQIVSHLHNIGDYLRWAVTCFSRHDVFFGHGTDNAWDEALALVLHALALPWNTDPQLLQANLTPSERLQVIDLVRQRVTQRLPLAYLTRKAWFADLEFFVDERVLIPRSPMAELIESQFAHVLPQESIRRIVDVGTGSGCIAIACAVYLPQADVIGIDVNEDALAVAKINVARHGVPVQLMIGDLLSGVQGEFDLIITNPPYASEEEWQGIPSEYHAEPKLALVSPEEGLQHVKRLLQQALTRLSEQGVLIVEVGYSQPQFEQVYPHLPVTWLEFDRGGQGVFMINRADLWAHRDLIEAVASESV